MRPRYAELKGYDTTQNMLTDLQNGRIDAVVNDVVGLRYAFTQMQADGRGRGHNGEKFAIMMPQGFGQAGSGVNRISRT